ncbi:MAG TPA: TlpA disulfide reductase family protein [Rhodanobacteraceae bacterium]|nr:TlpA disulfide reductase family protein [Rhodanobacteraceae bacterium]
MKRLLAAFLLVTFATFGAACAGQMPEHPQLSVTTLDGGHFDLAAQRGKWVIVNYWATWCRPCIKEMPDISAFVQQHANVRAIGLAYDDSPKTDIVAFAAKHPVVYPLAQVDTMNPPKDFSVPRGLPTTWLIGPDGRVAHTFLGPVTAAELGKIIDAP